MDDPSGPGTVGPSRYLPDEWTLPALDEHNEAYFTSGELLLERCMACGHVQHPASGVCIACQGVDTERIAVEPLGTVVSATVVHHVLNPMLRDRVPYNVVVVELRDHPVIRIVGNVVGTAEAAIPLGLGVRGVWTVPLGQQGVRLLQWEPA
jgi:uncharacterized OB-fold protein